MTVSIWSIIIGLGAFHGFFLSIILFARGNGLKTANLWFGLIIVIFSYALLEFTLLLSGQIRDVIHVFSGYVPLMFLLGPFLLFFTRESITSSRKLKGVDLLHLIPFLLIFISFIPFYTLTADAKLSILESLYERTEAVPRTVLAFNAAFFIHLGTYLFISRKTLKNAELGPSQMRKVKARVQNLSITLIVFFIIAFLCFIFVTFPVRWRLEVHYVLIVLFSLLIYFVSYRLLLSKEGQTFRSTPYAGKTLIQHKLQKEQLNELLANERPFLNSEIKLQDLASELGVSRHDLSQFVNQHYQTNFSGLMNQLRVKEAKRLLSADNSSKLLAIAFDSGFSNQANFIRVFKQYTSMTPSEFRDSHKN